MTTRVKNKTALKRRKPLRKQAKLKTRGWYTNNLEVIAKVFSKQRDGFVCQMTGEKVSGTNAHASHVIPKSLGLRFKFDLENLKCLSYHSHINVWHKDPARAWEWFKVAFPSRAAHLDNIRRQKLEISTAQLAEFYDKARACKDWMEYNMLFKREMKPFIRS